MTESPARVGVTEGTWLGPIALLLPVLAVRHLTDRGTPWQVLAWTCWALAALCAVAGWVRVARRRPRGAAVWGACLLLHVSLVSQAAGLA